MKTIFLEIETSQAKDFIERIKDIKSKYDPKFLMIGKTEKNGTYPKVMQLNFNLNVADSLGNKSRVDFPSNVIVFPTSQIDDKNKQIFQIDGSSDLIQICSNNDFYEDQLLDYFRNELQLKRAFSLTF